jgi:hypothetical protein
MNQQRFLESTLRALNGKPLHDEGLHEIVKKYPYCQTSQLLFYLSLLEKGDMQHFQRLRKVAAYAGDRKQLKKLTEHFRKISMPQHFKDDVSDNQNENAVHVLTEDSALQKFVGLKETEELHDGQKENIQPDVHQMDDTVPQKDDLGVETNDYNLQKAFPGKMPAQPNRTKQELIDQFIRNSPRITRRKSDFYDPVDYSKNSEIDKEDIVSETLATIYFKQENYKKAISVYQKLILKIPQKSSYFAAQIEKIKEIQKLNH